MRKKSFYRINQFILGKEFRVIDESGKQIGVMSRDAALDLAQKEDKDLVEIASRAIPPVCKIIDFKKFRYQEAKKGSGKKTKKSETKEIRLSPFIAENDLLNRLEKAKKFLKEKNQVRISILFRGRQIEKKEFGYKLAALILAKLEDCGQTSQEPKILGRQLIMIINPYEKKKTKN